jgi:CRP-like cAMP-binding protein
MGLDRTRHQRLFSKLEHVSLDQGTVIYEADSQMKYVYFPGSAVFSMLASMEDGKTVEIGPVGREGLVGLGVFLGGLKTPDRVLVHVGGSAMRLRASVLREELEVSNTDLSVKLLRYTRMLVAMTARSVACAKFHTVEQQFARWLLMISDYVGNDLSLTHELIALTLGVRRAGVTVVANALKTTGILQYRRKHIQVIERERLAEIACECYRVIKREYEELYADLSK